MASLSGFYSTFNDDEEEKKTGRVAPKKKKTALDSFYATFEQPAKAAPASSDYFKDPANQLAMFEEEPVKKADPFAKYGPPLLPGGSISEGNTSTTKEIIQNSFDRSMLGDVARAIVNYEPPFKKTPMLPQYQEGPLAKPEQLDAKGLGQNVAALGATMIGEAPTVAAAYLTGGAGATGLLGRLAPNAGKYAAMTVRGAGAGAVHGAARAALNNESLPDAAKTIGSEAFMFGLGDPAAHFAGGLAKNAFNALSKTNTPLIDALSPTVREEAFKTGMDIGDQISQQKKSGFATGMPGYTIDNANSLASGRGFSSLPDNGFPSNYLEQPARSGGSVRNIPGPGQRTRLTPDEAGYAKYALSETAAGREPMSPEEWWQSVQPQKSSPSIPQKLTVANKEQEALTKLQEGIQEAQNYVKHNDVLAAYPPGTTVEAAMADIKANTGVDLQALMADYEAARSVPGLREQVLNKAEYAPLGRVAGALPTPQGLYRPGRNIPQSPEFNFKQAEPARAIPQRTAGPLPRQSFERPGFPGFANVKPIPGSSFTPAPQRTPLIPQPGQSGQLPPGISPASFTIPEKMAPVGNGQKARSFQVSAAKAPITDDMTKAGLVSDIYPGGPGAYNPVKLKAVDVEARKMVNVNPEKAYRFVMEDKEPGALHTATGIRLIEKFQNLNNYDRAIDVAESLADKLTKQGQAISAARLMGALKPDGVLVFAQRQIRKINNSKAFNTKDLKLTPDMAKGLKELSQRVQDAADEGVRLEASQELQQALNSLKPAGIGRKIATAQTIAQLLNTKTIIRNVAGNELFYRLERLNKYPATLIDWTRSMITGGPRTVTFRTAGQGGYWQGFLKGAKAGWKGVNPQGITTQYDLGHGPAFNVKGNIAEKTMAYLERAMGATLKGFDHAGFNRAKNQTLGELATLRAINTTGRANPATVRQFMAEAEDNILNVADEYGKYVTFQDNNMISRGLVAVKRGLNKLTGSEDFGLGDIVLKYPKTPGALIARGLEYSPAGFLKSAYQLAKVKGILRGAADPREVTIALSRAITGTLGLTGLGYYLADVGIITGSADKDKDVRALQQQVGEGPYRVNVSALTRWVRSGFNRTMAQPQEGDRLITYDWAQPVAMAISAGANINQSIKEKATAEDAAKGMGATIAGSLEGAVNTIAEQPVLQGLTRPLQGYSLGESLTGVAKSIPASFAPTMGNQVRTYMDNTGRSTYDPNPAKEALNKAQLKMPFVAGKLPPAYNTFGQKKETYQDGSNNLFNVFLNPSFVSRYKLTPEARMVVDTFKETGETKQVPRVVPKKFIVSGKSFVLTPQEYSEFQRIVGEQTTEGFSRIPDWLPADKKIDRMTDVLTDAGRKGKKEILEARGIRVRKRGNGMVLMP